MSVILCQLFCLFNIGPLCEKACSRSYVPVCGTNSQTYVNSCELEVAMCYDERLRKASDGPCPSGKLNLSELEVAMCYDERLQKASDGPCPSGKPNP